MAKAKKLPSGMWRVLVYSHTENVNGKPKRIYESFTSANKKDCELQAAEFAKTKKRLKTPSNLLFSEAVENYIVDKNNVLSPSTIRGYRIIQSNCFSLLNNYPLDKIDENLIQKQINKNASAYSAKSISNQLGLISAVCRKYKLRIDFDYITKKPKEKKEIKIPTDKEVSTIITAVKNTEIEIPVLLAALQGLRQSEIAAVLWENFNGSTLKIHGAYVPDENNVLVKRNVNKSYSSARDIILMDYVRERLEALMPPTKKGRMSTMLPTSVLRAFKKLCRNNGLPEYTMHSLRHYRASIMLKLNVPDKYAMQDLGQSSPHMLKNTYQHTFTDEFLRIQQVVNNHYNSILQ